MRDSFSERDSVIGAKGLLPLELDSVVVLFANKDNTQHPSVILGQLQSTFIWADPKVWQQVSPTFHSSPASQTFRVQRIPIPILCGSRSRSRDTNGASVILQFPHPSLRGARGVAWPGRPARCRTWTAEHVEAEAWCVEAREWDAEETEDELDDVDDEGEGHGEGIGEDGQNACNEGVETWYLKRRSVVVLRFHGRK